MLQLKKIRKSYKTGSFIQNALDGVSVTFRNNEFAAILGPSGSGKTTMLNIIGGLDRYDSGELEIDGISTKKYKDRDWDAYRNNRIGFVFQSYNLIPHQSILANVELALTLSGVSTQERRERAIEVLERVGLKEHIKKKPSQLSGGQMQRVAIARALINNPSILLADEPTGALDTQTSKQVMSLLTEIAHDRLVIMVTHNNELASAHANRIIHLTDGKITSDSNPYDPSVEKESFADKIRKTSMSFFTAIALSFSNLMTKKTRTFITALAGSIGIIGIATIFALANGINIYIKNIEEETLSIYPLTIQNTGFDLASLMGAHGEAIRNSEETDENRIREFKIVNRVFSNRSKNDLAALKKYFDQNAAQLDPLVVTIDYKFDITPQIYLKDTSNGVHQVNPDDILSSYGMGQNINMGMGLMSGGTTVFREMPRETKLYIDQYIVLAGHWPSNYNEAVLVVTDRNRITDFALYSMGIHDREDLKTIIDTIINNEDSDFEADTDFSTYSYDTFLNVEFKVINPADKFQYDNKYDVWVDKSNDNKFIKSLVDEGIDLKIVGIVKPDVDSTANSLMDGVNYTPMLIDYLMSQAADKKVVTDQLNTPLVNVLTGKTFSEERDNMRNGFDFSKMITFDSKAFGSAMNMGSIDFSNISMDFSSIPLPNIDIQDILGMMASQINIPTADLTAIVNDVMVDFILEEVTNGVSDPAQMVTDFSAYIVRADVQANINARLATVITDSAIQDQLNVALSSYMASIMQNYMQQLMSVMMVQIQESMQSYFSAMPAQMQKAFTKAFKINMNEEDILELMTAIMNPTISTYERNMSNFGYADPLSPSQISIYPKDFNAKQDIIKLIDNYNEKMETANEPDKVVRYVDIVGVMMSSVTDIVDMVSYSLIAFVSISLIVSSIMIGVITYISVLERKKEIGILRAVGASKKDIRRVFNAETLIVGLVAGILGILVTLVISFFGNIVMFNMFSIRRLVRLPADVAFILIGVSMFLSFIAGLFPASAAARKDPVEALRAE